MGQRWQCVWMESQYNLIRDYYDEGKKNNEKVLETVIIQGNIAMRENLKRTNFNTSREQKSKLIKLSHVHVISVLVFFLFFRCRVFFYFYFSKKSIGLHSARLSFLLCFRAEKFVEFVSIENHSGPYNYIHFAPVNFRCWRQHNLNESFFSLPLLELRAQHLLPLERRFAAVWN